MRVVTDYSSWVTPRKAIVHAYTTARCLLILPVIGTLALRLLLFLCCSWPFCYEHACSLCTGLLNDCLQHTAPGEALDLQVWGRLRMCLAYVHVHTHKSHSGDYLCTAGALHCFGWLNMVNAWAWSMLAP